MRSLRGRLLLGAGALSLLAIAGVALSARQGARVELHQYLELRAVDRREDAVRALYAAAAAHPAGLATDGLPRVAQRLPPGFGVFLLDAGDGLLGAAGAGLGPEAALTVERRGEDLHLTLDRAGDVAALVLRGGGVPVRLAGAEGAAARGSLHLLPLPAPREDLAAAAALGGLDRRLLATTAAIGALALLSTAVFAHRLLVPIRELQAAARGLGRGDLAQRVAVRRDDEVGELARAFNRMAEELARQERLRRDLVADVAHELRAPLTALRCRVEAVQDGLDGDPAATLAALHHDVLHLGRLVDDLQELALADAGQLRVEPVPLELAPVVASALRAAGLEGDPRLAVDAGGLRVVADPVRLRQVLVNLLANAARHTPAGGAIRVAAEARDGAAHVEVADTGAGLAAEELARVFERFYRTDPSRRRETGGSGLGLAIVKSLVEAQGGRVWARAAPGGGTAFGFTLPLAGG